MPAHAPHRGNQVPSSILGDLSYGPKDHYWCLHVGWQLGRLEFFWGNKAFDEQMNAMLAKSAAETTDDIKRLLAPVAVSLHEELDSFAEISQRLMNDVTDRYGPEYVAFILIGMAAVRLSLAAGVDNPSKRNEMQQLARSCLTSVTGIYIADKDALFDRMTEASIEAPPQLADLLLSIQRASSLEQTLSPAEPENITVLFATADPTDASRLRIGEECRNIQQMLQIARYRDRYRLVERFSVRVPDLTQVILDEKPSIVHFCGHGTSTGAICFESVTGQMQEVEPEALAALFSAAGGVQCVVLNACFSATQAEAITKVVPFVVGMKKEIGDPAAIAFATGFYQALGAGRSIPDAFRFGIVSWSS